MRSALVGNEQIVPESQMSSPDTTNVKYTKGVLETNHSTTDNRITTSRYTWYTFFPQCLLEQMIRPANTYFILIGILQSFGTVSTTDGVPVIAMPLCVVFAVAMIKLGLEDYNRHKSDRNENEKNYLKVQVASDAVEGEQSAMIPPNKAILETIASKNIKVGDIICVREGQSIPADILLVGVAPKNNHERPATFCHIETSNIDGETSLKVRMVPEVLNSVETPLFDLSGSHLEKKGRCSHMMSLDEAEFRAAPVADGMFSSCFPAETSTIPIKSFDNLWKDFSMSIDVSESDGDLDKWKGSQASISRNDKQSETVQMSMENLLVRGAVLENTRYIFGMVVYTGRDCKVFKNSQKSKVIGKSSRFEKTMNNIIFLMALLLIALCFVMMMSTYGWTKEFNPKVWYLRMTDVDPIEFAGIRFFTWLIVFSQLVPVSLLVSLEMTRYLEGKTMEADPQMKKTFKVGRSTKTRFCKVQDSAMNEDLGRVEFVFSDKTGTLTENVLDFRQLLVAGNKPQGGGYTQIAWTNLVARGEFENLVASEDTKALMQKFKLSEAEATAYLNLSRQDLEGAIKLCEDDHDFTGFEHIRFNKTCRREMQSSLARSTNKSMWEKLVPTDKGGKMIHPAEFPDLMNEIYFKSLIFNNDVFPVHDDETQEIHYNADTPDDVCFAWICKYIGVELVPYVKPFKDLDIKFPGIEGNRESWRELQLLKFTSAKKRMSVVMEHHTKNGEDNSDGNVYVFIKGADDVIYSLASPESCKYYDENMRETVEQYCNEGLRTLLLGYAVYSKEWWVKNWQKRFEANLDDEAREQLEIEFDKTVTYHIIGVTAVEDKLQDQVPETIQNLLNAGIRTWILTGDKKETAINIGYACNLLTPDMKDNNLLHDVTHENYQKIFQEMENLNNDGNLMVKSGKPAKHGMVITGQAVETIFNETEEVQNAFVRFALNCHSIVACRLQPSQKARIVRAIKEGTGCITLAIGDGANDEAMIKVANIGVGIAGLEGTTAARASDYAISQFRMLNNLLFVHGRNCYRGTTYLVFYSFYKNMIHIFSFFFFAFYSGFSAQPLYLEWVWQMWNTFFTAFPIFVFALVDRDVSDEVLLARPETYSITNGNDAKPPLQLATKIESPLWRFINNTVDLDAGKLFNWWLFRNWVVECLLQSAFVLNVIIFSFGSSTSFVPEGHTWGLMGAALAIFTVYFFLMNMILCLRYSHWSFWHIFFMSITVIGYFLFMIFVNAGVMGFNFMAGYDWKGLVTYFYGNGLFWAVVYMCICVTLYTSQIPLLIRGLFFTSSLHKFQSYTKQSRSFCTCKVPCTAKAKEE